MVIKEIPVSKDGKYIFVIEFEDEEGAESFNHYSERFRDTLIEFFDSDIPVLVVSVIGGIELKLIDVSKVQETEDENRNVVPELAPV